MADYAAEYIVNGLIHLPSQYAAAGFWNTHFAGFIELREHPGIRTLWEAIQAASSEFKQAAVELLTNLTSIRSELSVDLDVPIVMSVWSSAAAKAHRDKVLRDVSGGEIWDDNQENCYFQFFTKYSAVRHASACTVRVGFLAPLDPMTDAPRIPRFGTSWEKPQRSTTLVSGLSPMRVPP